MNLLEKVSIEYNCNICGSPGTAMMPKIFTGRNIPIICDGCDADKTLAQIAKKEAMSLVSRLDKSGLKKEFTTWDKSIAKYPQLPRWVYDNRDNNIIISAKVGSGKTRSVTVAADHILKNSSRTVRLVRYGDMLDDYMQSVRGESWGTAALLTRYVGYDILIIDDLGKGNVSPGFSEFLFRVIDSRHISKATWITTKLDLSRLASWLGPAIGNDIIRRLNVKQALWYDQNEIGIKQ